MSIRVRSFGEIFDQVYADPKRNGEIVLSEANEIRKSFSAGLGHPHFDDIQLGETIPGTLIVFFMDIRGFTKMAIALGNDELVKILQAITIASIYSVQRFGGYVAEFTGDGIMAFFGGERPVTKTEALNAVKASCFMMRGIKESVNKHLNRTLDETVRVGMGLEYGNVLWTRIGINGTSQVKPISEISFVAGKNSSHASSWEIVIGKNMSDWIPEQFKEKYEAYTFQKDGKKYEYPRSLLKWEAFNSLDDSTPTKLEQLLLSKALPTLPIITVSSGNSLSYTPSNKSKNGGPRPLKDQPFFQLP